MSSIPTIQPSDIDKNLLTKEQNKSKSCSLGRSFKKIANATMQIAKVGLIFGLVIGACLLPAAPMLAAAYNATHPVGYSPLPASAPPLGPLVRTASYMTPGQTLARSGTASCSVAGFLFNQQQCEQAATQALQHLYTGSNPQERFTQAELDTAYKQGISRTITNDHGAKLTFTFLLPQKRAKNYEKALKYAEWAFIQDTQAFQGSEERTIQDIKVLHRILTEKEYTITENTMARLKELVQFLHARMKKGGDYIDHAAFFHAVFVRIAPYEEGTKKLARLMTQAILVAGDHHPVVFHSDAIYKKAMQESSANHQVFAAFLRVQLEWTKKYISDIEDPLGRRIINEARYMHPGLQLVNLGREACVLTDVPESVETCEKGVLQQLVWIEAKKVFELHDIKNAANEKGVLLSINIDNAVKKMHFKINPDKYTNYKNALYFIEYSILQNPQLLQESPKETLEFITHIHTLLMNGIEIEEPYLPGKYRTGFMIIDGVGKPELLLARGKEKLPAPDFNLFIESITKIQQDITHLGRLSETEQRIWQKVAHIPPSPDSIEQDMRTFATQLTAKLCHAPSDYLDLASWAHSEIARIWPFPDGNGRLARIIMNTLFRLGGQKPIICNSDAEYIEAVSHGVQNHAAFTVYLQKMRAWNKQYVTIF